MSISIRTHIKVDWIWSRNTSSQCLKCSINATKRISILREMGTYTRFRMCTRVNWVRLSLFAGGNWNTTSNLHSYIHTIFMSIRMFPFFRISFASVPLTLLFRAVLFSLLQNKPTISRERKKGKNNQPSEEARQKETSTHTHTDSYKEWNLSLRVWKKALKRKSIVAHVGFTISGWVCHWHSKSLQCRTKTIEK